MWVLDVAWECPGRGYGGLGTAVTKLVPAIAELGHRVVHACTGEPGCYKYMDTLCCSFRATVVSKEGALGRGEAVALSSACVELVGGFDYVLVHDFHGSGCVWIAKELGIKAGFFVHAAMDPVLESTAISAADYVFANSKLTASELKSLYGVDARVVYLPPPYPVRKREKAFRRAPRILILTRFQANKDPGWVLRILEETYKKRGGFEVILAGRGTQLYNYSYPWLRVLGEVTEEEKIRLIQSSDVLVYPSITEPYGLIPLESIALGTPALVSKTSGVSEVLPSDGLLDPDNPDESRRVLEELVGNPRRLSELLEKQQSAEIMKKTWVDAAREVLPR